MTMQPLTPAHTNEPFVQTTLMTSVGDFDLFCVTKGTNGSNSDFTSKFIVKRKSGEYVISKSACSGANLMQTHELSLAGVQGNYDLVLDSLSRGAAHAQVQLINEFVAASVSHRNEQTPIIDEYTSLFITNVYTTYFVVKIKPEYLIAPHNEKRESSKAGSCLDVDISLLKKSGCSLFDSYGEMLQHISKETGEPVSDLEGNEITLRPHLFGIEQWMEFNSRGLPTDLEEDTNIIQYISQYEC